MQQTQATNEAEAPAMSDAKHADKPAAIRVEGERIRAGIPDDLTPDEALTAAAGLLKARGEILQILSNFGEPIMPGVGLDFRRSGAETAQIGVRHPELGWIVFSLSIEGMGFVAGKAAAILAEIANEKLQTPSRPTAFKISGGLL